MIQRRFNRLLLAILLGGLLLLGPTALLAQEDIAATESAPTEPQGISTLVFLLGAGAIIVVGGAMMARDSYKSDGSEQPK